MYEPDIWGTSICQGSRVNWLQYFWYQVQQLITVNSGSFNCVKDANIYCFNHKLPHTSYPRGIEWQFYMLDDWAYKGVAVQFKWTSNVFLPKAALNDLALLIYMWFGMLKMLVKRVWPWTKDIVSISGTMSMCTSRIFLLFSFSSSSYVAAIVHTSLLKWFY